MPTAAREANINAGPVYCVENHDAAYAVWRDAGVSRRVLVHVDAHHDMYGGWINRKDPNERSRINIANFLYAALEEELVREVIWVVPDQTWATRAGRRDIARELKSLDQGERRGKPAIRVERDRITATVLGKPIQVCTVQNLPALSEAVLLDIDIDYFVIPNVGYRGIGAYGTLPWCWPAALLAQLNARGLRADLTTIAYSVEGGYTPLQWKYLGDELAQRLQADSADLAWTDRMRDAALSAGRGELALAERHYLAARTLRPELAAPCFHLAHLCAATDRIEAGREYLRQAYDLDPSYRSPYNNAGWWYLEKHRREQARGAFTRALSLDPDDAYAHLGLGLLAVQEAKWPEAETSLRQALSLNESCIEAWRALGQALARRRAYPEAIDAYERSLKLALSGRRALTNQITLGEAHGWRTPWDPEHGVVLGELARLDSANGAWEKAITDLRMAIAAGGVDPTAARMSLAMLYARGGRWRDCVKAISEAAKCLPRSLTNSMGRLQAWCRERIEIRRETCKPKGLRDAEPQVWI